jgi:DeoR/GlpR family transcriptional regulator of sugar metabolism
MLRTNDGHKMTTSESLRQERQARAARGAKQEESKWYGGGVNHRLGCHRRKQGRITVNADSLITFGNATNSTRCFACTFQVTEDSPERWVLLRLLIVHGNFLFMHGSSGAIRKNEIESRLLRGLPVNATALAREFLVSEDAIRRDLRALAAEGKCKRVYGGGLPISPDGVPFEHRLLNGSKEKRALALAALTLVSEASTVFLDSGSTNLALAIEMPPDRSLTIATNSISIASALLDRKNFKVIVLGGEIDRETGAAIGLSAIREAERLSFDLCFLGACAVSVSLGIGAFQMADAEFKRTLIARSDRIGALVTMDKVETRAPFQVAALAVLDHVVLESGTSEEIISTFSNAGPKVIIGQP